MLKKIILSIIIFYKKTTSPFINRGYTGCRFYPTCSDYSYNAIVKKGALIGSFLAFKRILKCNPLFKGGVDEI